MKILYDINRAKYLHAITELTNDLLAEYWQDEQTRRAERFQAIVKVQPPVLAHAEVAAVIDALERWGEITTQTAASGTGKCEKCGQSTRGQGGEYPCPVCGVPTMHDDLQNGCAHRTPLPAGNGKMYCKDCGKYI